MKGRVYNAAVRSVLLYGCESWSLRSQEVNQLSVFDHRCLRSITRVWWQQHVSNTEVRRQVFGDAGTEAIVDRIAERQLRWLGHVLRMSGNRLPRRALFSVPDESWRKQRGGQPMTWCRRLKTLASSLARVGASRLPGWGPKDPDHLWLKTLEDMAQNRSQWRSCCGFILSTHSP